MTTPNPLIDGMMRVARLAAAAQWANAPEGPAPSAQVAPSPGAFPPFGPSQQAPRSVCLGVAGAGRGIVEGSIDIDWHDAGSSVMLLLAESVSPRGPRGINPPFLRGESVQSLNKIHLFRSLRGPSQLRVPIEGFRLLPSRSF